MKASYMGENFVVFANFLQTTKVFPTNFISVILSANGYYAEICFHSCQKQNCESFPYIMMISNESQTFSHVTFVIYNLFYS